MKSSATTAGKCGYRRMRRSGSRVVVARGEPGAGAATSWKSTISPTRATAHSPAVAKKA